MKCPKCLSGQLKVNEKRDLDGDSAIRRRRSCLNCGHRFTTYERIEVPSLIVVKRNGEREQYSLEKLSSGVEKAFEKRPFDKAEIFEIIEEIDQEINRRGEKEIASLQVGDIVMNKIKDLDDVAYLRFASVYKSFDDVDMFRKELEIIGEKPNKI